MIRYLGRYTNRVAISNGRLVAIVGDDVHFRYKDYRDSDCWKTKVMPGVEFLGRFLSHLLPQGMQHIRHFGFMGNNRAGGSLAKIRALLAAQGSAKNTSAAGATSDDAREEEQTTDPVQEQIERVCVCRRCGVGRLELIDEVPRPSVIDLMRMRPDMQGWPERPPRHVTPRSESTEDASPPRQLTLPIEIPACYHYS